ncbi:OmpA family protein [Mangrovimonas aestuarii]|uniref:OmpA family protein n=1 Tax=Mangrovimonas aestuarii TaxID=3018443 RepID=UPI002378D060|nr:OmpA family protein [Mangrovimonas aestuarii]
MKQIKVLLGIALMGTLSLSAQNNDTKKADKHFSRFEFVEAIEDYEQLVEQGKGDEYVYARLAEANYNIFNTVDAEKWYAKALETSTDPSMMFEYSQMLKANGKYEQSNEWMRKFAAARPSDERAMAFMANPDYLPKILEKGKKFNVQNLDINTPASDFGGAFKDGKLYIASARNSARRTYGWNEQPFLDIYSFDKAEDGTFGEEVMVSKKVNTKFHEGTVAFSPDGNTMYYSSESFFSKEYEKDEETNTKYSVVQLFKANKMGDDWDTIEQLPFNSQNYSIKDPAVSPDGKWLYYSSNQPGGIGKFDIYKVEINADGSFGRPENLGPKVNTEGNEGFPFVSDNGTLYFSSDSWLGLGGMDVFYTKEIDGTMANARNVGIPLNSSADDFAYTINEETGEGFVSSNRSGGKGSDDVYAVKQIQPLCDVVTVIRAVDHKTGQPLPGATITLFDDQGSKLMSKIAEADGTAEFIVECDDETSVEVTMAEYESASKVIEGTSDPENNVDVELDPIEKIITPVDIKLNPIYFEFDKSNITSQAAFELDKLVEAMNKYPEMVIQVYSHTDRRGPDSYNMALSDRRAKTSVQYVVSKGIDASRISGEGKGETEPAVDCTQCTEEQHQLNRRSEFLIVTGSPKATEENQEDNQ